MDGSRRPLRRYLIAWGPVALWAAVIFLFSTRLGSFSNTTGILARLLVALDADFTADQIDTLHLVVRKLSHWCEYFIFALLILRALRIASGSARRPHSRHIALTLWVVVAYAITDEWHQALVPDRGANATDVIIDAFGGLCGVLWTHFYAGRRPRASARAQKT